MMGRKAMGRRREQELQGVWVASVLIVSATVFMAVNVPGYLAEIIEENPLLLIGMTPLWLLLLTIFGMGWYTLLRAVFSATRGRRGLARLKLLLGLEH